MHRPVRSACLPALVVLLVGTLAPIATVHAASEPVRTDHLTSRLVAESTAAVPGESLTLGLLLEHDPHWHTYWRNAGDSGLPTVIELELPDGVTAEPIAWPHPHRFELSEIVNYGYSERQLLPVTIEVPAGYDAASLPIRAKANWLICEVECIPGKAEYAFDLPVAPSGEADPRWAEDFAAARAGQPQAADATLAVADAGDVIAFTLTGLADDASPEAWTWFPETPQLVANTAQPTWQRSADGREARWTKDTYFTGMPADVVLVAVDDQGKAWRFVTTDGVAASRLSPTR